VVAGWEVAADVRVGVRTILAAADVVPVGRPAIISESGVDSAVVAVSRLSALFKEAKIATPKVTISNKPRRVRPKRAT
jgi:hypothetical protein